MTVAIVSTWTGGYAPPGGFFFPRSATGPSQVAVANAAGDWMIAAAAWLQPVAGAGTSMALADDVHNWWEPAGPDSQAAGQVRCSVWAAPAARAANYVQAAPTGAATSNAVAVWDVAGIGPGWAPFQVSSDYTASGTTLTLGGGTAPAQSLVISVLGANEWGVTVTPPAGWTALTGSTIEGISNAPANITVAAAYQVITGAIPAATWTVGSACALAGVTVAIPLAAAAPAQASPNWPAVITEAATGSGPQSAPSSLAWTDLSSRSLALSVQQGRQYSLSQLQAAQGTITLDDPDGALIPQPSTRPGMLVGAFLSASAYGAPGYAGALTAWSSLTGLANPVTRWYKAAGDFGYDSTLQAMVAAGARVCLSLRPAYNPVSPSDLAAVQALLATLKAAGADVEVALWHEPNFNGLTAAQYIAMTQYYSAAVRQYYPLWCVFSGASADQANGWFPGAAYVDGIAVDAYALSGEAQVANAQSMADGYGLPLGVWEFNGSFHPGGGDSQAAVTAHFAYLQSVMAARLAAGKRCGNVIFFSSGPANFLGTGLSQEAGFEGGLSTWVGAGNATVAQTTAQAHSGTGSLAITAAGTSNARAGHCNTTSGTVIADGMPVTAGQLVGAAAWFKAQSAPRADQVQVAWFDGTGAPLSTSSGATVTDATTGWAEPAGSFAAPAAGYAVLQLQVNSPGGAGEVHWADDAWLLTYPSVNDLTTPVQFGWDYRIGLLQAMQRLLSGTSFPPGLDSGTPLRRRCYWPGGAWQVQFHGDGVTGAPQVQSSSNQVPVTAGAAYTAGAWLASSAPWASGVHAGIVWRNNVGGVISTISSAASATGPAPVLCTASGTAPAGAVTADVLLSASGTPPSSTVFTASAAPAAAGQVTAPPAVAWAANNNATVTTLAPWQPDPRGAPSVTPWAIPFSGYFRRWPFSVPGDGMRGQTIAEVSDIWAYATGSLDSIAREEMLIDGPYALWPLNDAAGATAASNIAPGNGNPLNLITAKLGTGGATQAWAQDSGALLGDSAAKVTGSSKSGGGSGVYQLKLAGTSQNTNGYGYSLACTDTGFPQLGGNGVTVETWFSCTANVNTGAGFFNIGNTITVTGSSFANGTPVVFAVAPGETLPSGMTAGQIYYVIAQSGATFSISTTIGGSAVTLSTNGAGFADTTTSFNPSVLALRNAGGTLFSVNVGNNDGRLFVSGHSVATTTIDTSRDWRSTLGLIHVSVALTSSTWRVIIDGGEIGTSSGSLTSAPAWNELCLGGVMDRLSQGFALPGELALAVVYPYVLPPNRVVAHFWGASAGMRADPAHERIDRILGYAGLAGRRWIGQQGTTYEQDAAPSGQDIGGQSAATSAGNIAASTVPATLYIAPTGDTVYWAKQYAWNQAVRWTLGDSTAGGEIPFDLAQFSTDYDPTRLYNDVQLTQLDSQSVTVPAGSTASTTVAAMTAASQAQYGDQPYKQTSYLNNDYTAGYTAGSGLVDLAAWIAMVYGKPRNRVPGVIVNAAAYPAAWPLFLQASAGDMVQVNVRLPTAATSPVVSVIARITQAQRAMKWDTEGAPVATIALTLDAAPECQALTCDDSVRGVLNGSNVLAW